MKETSVKEQKSLLKFVWIPFMLVIILILAFLEKKYTLVSESWFNLVQVLFTTVAVVSGLWVTCYLLFFQVYKDRYPITIIKNRLLPEMKRNFVHIGFIIILGCYKLLAGYGLLTSIAFCILALGVILIILIYVYKTNKSLMLNTYIDNIGEEVQIKLESCDISGLKKALTIFSGIIDESIVKEEYFVTKNVIRKMGSIFTTFLSNSIQMRLKCSSEESIKDSLGLIIKKNIAFLDMCSGTCSDLLISLALSQQIENISTCVKTDQYEVFKSYLSEYNHLISKEIRSRNEEFADKIYSTYSIILCQVIDEEKREWLVYAINELKELNSTMLFVYQNINISNYADLLTGLLLYCYREQKKDAYVIILASLQTLISQTVKRNGAFDDVKAFFAMVFNELLQTKLEKAYEFYKTIYEGELLGNWDTTFIEFSLYCIGEFYDAENNENSEIIVDCYKWHIEILKKIIVQREKYSGYIKLPEYKKMIIDNHYDSEKISIKTNDIIELLDYCITNNNTAIFYLLLRDTNEILESTSRSQKEIQIKVYDIYIWLIYRTKAIVNKRYSELVFEMLSRMLKKIDQKKTISEGFASYIIEKLDYSADCSYSDSHETVIKVIELLYSFLEEGAGLVVFSSSTDFKKKIGKVLFNIGTDCIENDFESGLRKVSNSLGWLIIHSFEHGNPILSNYLIERAGELYEISKNMEISSKTMTFILTLFTTVGSFCCKDSRYNNALGKILSYISSSDEKAIRTAISLRTGENDTWDELFEGKTADLTKAFLAKFNAYKTSLKK